MPYGGESAINCGVVGWNGNVSLPHFCGDPACQVLGSGAGERASRGATGGAKYRSVAGHGAGDGPLSSLWGPQVPHILAEVVMETLDMMLPTQDSILMTFTGGSEQ